MVFNNKTVTFEEKIFKNESANILVNFDKLNIEKSPDQVTIIKKDIDSECDDTNINENFLENIKTIRIENLFTKDPDWDRLGNIDYLSNGQYLITNLSNNSNYLSAFVVDENQVISLQTRLFRNVTSFLTATWKSQMYFAITSIKDDGKTKEITLNRVNGNLEKTITREIDQECEQIFADAYLVYVISTQKIKEINTYSKSLVRVFSIDLQFSGFLQKNNATFISKYSYIQNGLCFILDSDHFLWKGSIDSGLMEKFIQLDDECDAFFVTSYHIYVFKKDERRKITSKNNTQAKSYLDIYNFSGKLVKIFQLNFSTKIDKVIYDGDKCLSFVDHRNKIIYKANEPLYKQ